MQYVRLNKFMEDALLFSVEWKLAKARTGEGAVKEHGGELST